MIERCEYSPSPMARRNYIRMKEGGNSIFADLVTLLWKIQNLVAFYIKKSSFMVDYTHENRINRYSYFFIESIYCDGDMPSYFLNIRLRCCGKSKPRA